MMSRKTLLLLLISQTAGCTTACCCGVLILIHSLCLYTMIFSLQDILFLLLLHLPRETGSQDLFRSLFHGLNPVSQFLREGSLDTLHSDKAFPTVTCYKTMFRAAASSLGWPQGKVKQVHTKAREEQQHPSSYSTQWDKSMDMLAI